MTKTVYKASNINGMFDHFIGKKDAVSYARSIERDETLSAKELTEEFGWTFKKVSASVARSVGF